MTSKTPIADYLHHIAKSHPYFLFNPEKIELIIENDGILNILLNIDIQYDEFLRNSSKNHIQEV